jgi:glycosyltransferase involved in cell wall biosynthesis
MPKVSIVIPTRNRGFFLRYALYSALNQTYKDIEIVVSDNCSTDNTIEVVNLFNDLRLRYVRANKTLDLADSWEFACSHAKGEYLALLTDDCFYFKNAIERAIMAIEQFNVKVAVWDTCTYYYPEWHEQRRKNTLYIRKRDAKQLLLSDDAMKNLFDLYIQYPYPKFLNSLIDITSVQNKI